MTIVARQDVIAAPVPAPGFVNKLSIAPATVLGDVTTPSQMAWGPDGRLYVARTERNDPPQNILSYAYNPNTRQLSDRRDTGLRGMGVAFATHAVPGAPAPVPYMYVSHRENGFEAVLSRYSNTNENFTWGEIGAGEINVDIVRGVPLGDHSMNQIKIANNTLYVGIGVRTQNGRDTAGTFHDTKEGPEPGGVFNGDEGLTFGETSYNGTIAWIQNLSLVPNETSAAQLRDGPNGTSGNLLAGRDAFLPEGPHSTKPYTSTAPDKLIVHSAGTRNPFGLALDSQNRPWFTNNHGRANTNGNGTSEPNFHDLLDSDFSNDVGDQFFLAQAGGDYRYDNVNFRDNPAFPDTPIVSTTFDNLDSDRPGYNVLHDPANPNGLGPSSSSNGFDFVKLRLNGLNIGTGKEYAVITRWVDEIEELPPGTDVLQYQDVVIVDPLTGSTTRALTGFANPIDVLRDGRGGFFIADYTAATIYHVEAFAKRPAGPPRPTETPEPSYLCGLLMVATTLLTRRDRVPVASGGL